MKLMNQEMVYESVGKKIKADLYDGNAVVLFAYGLSGSGKTFTVFGPDAVDIPEVGMDMMYKASEKRDAKRTGRGGDNPLLLASVIWPLTTLSFQTGRKGGRD